MLYIDNQLDCPDCAKTFDFPYWLIVDADESDGAIQRQFIDNPLHKVKCPYCGCEGDIDDLFIYRDNRHKVLLIATPQNAINAMSLTKSMQQLKTFVQPEPYFDNPLIFTAISHVSVLIPYIAKFVTYEVTANEILEEQLFSLNKPTWEEIKGLLLRWCDGRIRGGDKLNGGHLLHALRHTAQQREDRELLAEVFLLIGETASNSYELDEAREAYETALTYFTEQYPSMQYVRCLNNLALVYKAQNRLVDASRTFNLALEIVEMLPSSHYAASILSNLAEIEYSREQFHIALVLTERTLKDHRYYGEVKAVATDLNTIGLVQRALGNFDAATAAYMEALSIYKIFEFSDGIAACLHNLGNIEQIRANFDEAHNFYQQAYEVHRQSNNVNGQASTCLSLGLLELQQGNTNKARQFYDLVLTTDSENDVDIKWRGLAGIGNVYSYDEHNVMAMDYYRSAIVVIESSRGSLLEESDRIDYFNEQPLTVYVNLIRCLMREHLIKEAWEVVQKTRSRAFAEILANQPELTLIKLTEWSQVADLLKLSF